MNCQLREEHEWLELICPFLSSPNYLVRQAACRSLPALIPIKSIRSHLLILPGEIAEAYEMRNWNGFCGLIELMEIYIRYLVAGNNPEDRDLCFHCFIQIKKYLLEVDITLVVIMIVILCVGSHAHFTNDRMHCSHGYYSSLQQ